MNTWEQRLKDAGLSERIAAVIEKLDQAVDTDAVKEDRTAQDAIQRTKMVLAFIRGRLKQIDANLLTPVIIGGLGDALASADGEAQNFLNNANLTHIKTNLVRATDQALSQAYLLPIRVTKKDVEALAESAQEYKNNVAHQGLRGRVLT